MYTHVCETGSRDEDGGDKAWGFLQGMLGRDTTFGLPVSAGLGVDPEMAHSYWTNTMFSSMTIKSDVKSFDKPCQLLQI